MLVQKCQFGYWYWDCYTNIDFWLHKHWVAFSDVPEMDENKDVDLRVLHPVGEQPAPITQKRPSTEAIDSKAKKNKHDKFDM